MTRIYIYSIAAASLFVWIAIVFNRFVKYRNRCSNAASQIDIQLKRRHQLIPDIVEIVKGYAAHEARVFDEVTKSRSEAVAARQKERTGKENNLSKSLKSLIALKEQYPSLKASGNFIRLQDELKETEEKIRFSRQIYNDIVMRYNTLISSFPDLILARLFHFRELEYFEFLDS
ncbi:MAG: LemA family protein [Candidatus Krumholzibacteriota bacterium]|nr:LemA family protein [Candidatus Krumholzibacteriota bacterium]